MLSFPENRVYFPGFAKIAHASSQKISWRLTIFRAVGLWLEMQDDLTKNMLKNIGRRHTFEPKVTLRWKEISLAPQNMHSFHLLPLPHSPIDYLHRSQMTSPPLMALDNCPLGGNLCKGAYISVLHFGVNSMFDNEGVLFCLIIDSTCSFVFVGK